MYFSSLLIDVGTHPDRPRPGRLWLRNLYRVHQRLCMAFMSDGRKSADPEFLQPYKPYEIKHDQVHVERADDAGFLFRIDPFAGGRVMILVQSAVEPDWDYAFHNAGHFLAAPPQTKRFDPCFKSDKRLRFRLVVNPTRRVETKTQADGKRRHGRRVPVPSIAEMEEWNRNNPHADIRPFIRSRLLDWLLQRAQLGGFTVDRESTVVQPGYVYMGKSANGAGQRLRSARYDGILTVIDAQKFGETIAHGIGPAKAFGFGLVSVAALTILDPAQQHADSRPPRAAEVS